MDVEFDMDRLDKETQALYAKNQYQFIKNINESLESRNVADMKEYVIGFNIYLATLNNLQTMNIRSQNNGK